MANIADGFVTVISHDEELLDDLRSRISEGPFNYGGPADIDAFGKKDGRLDVGFTGRWSCESAWKFFEGLMEDEEYTYRKALIDSEISGIESEEGTVYTREISKLSGKVLITR